MERATPSLDLTFECSNLQLELIRECAYTRLGRWAKKRVYLLAVAPMKSLAAMRTEASLLSWIVVLQYACANNSLIFPGKTISVNCASADESQRRLDLGTRTYVIYRALRAIRVAGVAESATVPDKSDGVFGPVFFGIQILQIDFDLVRLRILRQSEPS